MDNSTGAELSGTRIRANMESAEIIKCRSRRYKIEYKTVETIEKSEITHESTSEDKSSANSKLDDKKFDTDDIRAW